MKLCVGLTGGIGCGKSTVTKLFAEHGAGIVDTDIIARQLTQDNGDAIPSIREFFGGKYLTDDGALNRGKMRTLVFSDTLAKRQLESILHPLILAQTENELRRLQVQPYIILVVPLLFSSPDFQRIVQRVLVVDCAEETQVARVMARSRMSRTEAHQIIAQQTSRTKRLEQADDVIRNDSSLDNLAEQVEALHKIYSTTQNSN